MVINQQLNYEKIPNFFEFRKQMLELFFIFILVNQGFHKISGLKFFKKNHCDEILNFI